MPCDSSCNAVLSRLDRIIEQNDEALRLARRADEQITGTGEAAEAWLKGRERSTPLDFQSCLQAISAAQPGKKHAEDALDAVAEQMADDIIAELAKKPL